MLKLWTPLRRKESSCAEWLIPLFCLLLLLVIIFLDTQAQPRHDLTRTPNSSNNHPTASIRSARFRGRVVQIDAEQARLTVKHDPVPELEMETMTMPFLVKERASLSELKVGDVVTAIIYEERESGRMWLENVTREESPPKNNKRKSARKKNSKKH